MNISELILVLARYRGDRLVIMNDDGNTYGIDKWQISLWDKNDPESPVQITI